MLHHQIIWLFQFQEFISIYKGPLSNFLIIFRKMQQVIKGIVPLQAVAVVVKCGNLCQCDGWGDTASMIEVRALAADGIFHPDPIPSEACSARSQSGLLSQIKCFFFLGDCFFLIICLWQGQRRPRYQCQSLTLSLGHYWCRVPGLLNHLKW